VIKVTNRPQFRGCHGAESEAASLLTTAGAVYGVLADVAGRGCPDDSRVTRGRLVLHLRLAVPAIGPRAEVLASWFDRS